MHPPESVHRKHRCTRTDGRGKAQELKCCACNSASTHLRRADRGLSACRPADAAARPGISYGPKLPMRTMRDKRKHGGGRDKNEAPPSFFIAPDSGDNAGWQQEVGKSSVSGGWDLGRFASGVNSRRKQSVASGWCEGGALCCRRQWPQLRCARSWVGAGLWQSSAVASARGPIRRRGQQSHQLCCRAVLAQGARISTETRGAACTRQRGRFSRAREGKRGDVAAHYRAGLLRLRGRFQTFARLVRAC